MTDAIKELLIKEYGFNDGFRIYTVVIPSITKDFMQKLNSSLIGLPISEEYCFDDLKGSITLYGIRLSNGNVKINSIKINDKLISYL